MELEIDKIFGLPAHPLFAHLPVVLIPLTAIGAVVCAFSRSWRARIGWVIVGLAFVSVVSVQLAKGSGEKLEESEEESELIETHAEMAQSMLPIAGGLFIASVAMMGADHVSRRREREGDDDRAAMARRVGAGLAAVTVVMAGLSTVWVIRTGHSGAKAVWGDSQGEGDEDDDD